MSNSDFQEIAEDDLPQSNALKTLEMIIPPDWIDYNGHMTEWRYYKLMADAGEVHLRAIGFTEEYRLKGYSFFNVQGQQRNLKECRVGTPLATYSEIIGFDRTRLHLYQYVVDTDRCITVATGEHMMLHVDTQLRRAAPMESYMYDSISEHYELMRPTKKPKGLGIPFLEIYRTYVA